VAVKLPKRHCTQIEAELTIMNGLNHDHIMKHLDTVQTPIGRGIVYPLAEGGDLFGNLQVPLPPETVTSIAFHMLGALSYLHSKGIWHRDLKPENILVMDASNIGGSVVLSDFGLAARSSDRRALAEACGSVFYAAPEIYQGRSYDETVDIWALGVTLCACATRALPMNTAQQEWAIEDIKAGLPALPAMLEEFKIPGALSHLIQQMLEPDPDARISASEALRSPVFADRVKVTEEQREKKLTESEVPKLDSAMW
jgi:serine/threonine protein kinase